MPLAMKYNIKNIKFKKIEFCYRDVIYARYDSVAQNLFHQTVDFEAAKLSTVSTLAILSNTYVYNQMEC